MTDQHEGPSKTLIYRIVPFSREAFDRFKDYQRQLEFMEGCRLSNGQVMDRLLLSLPGPRASAASRAHHNHLSILDVMELPTNTTETHGDAP
mgnify:CR=1 FL=1